MTALANARVGGSIRFINRDMRPMAANAKVYQGALVVAFLSGASSGYYAQMQAGTGVAVGRATGFGSPLPSGGMLPGSFSFAPGNPGEVVDNTGGANGALFVEVEYLNPFWVMLMKNDTVSPVVVADRENVCYGLDDQTVTHASSGNMIAGTVYDVTSEGVWVRVNMGGAVAGT